MKNGLGALDRALDTLAQAGVEDNIPIFDAAHIELVVADARQALNDVRELCKVVRVLYAEVIAPLDAEPPYPEARDVLDQLDALMKPREGTRS